MVFLVGFSNGFQLLKTKSICHILVKNDRPGDDGTLRRVIFDIDAHFPHFLGGDHHCKREGDQIFLLNYLLISTPGNRRLHYRGVQSR